MCTSLTGLEVSYGGEEGMGMSSAAAEVPNGDLSMRYIVCTSSLLCVPRVVITYSVKCLYSGWVVWVYINTHQWQIT